MIKEPISPLIKISYIKKRGILTENIKWNFAKLLVGSNAHVITGHASQTFPTRIEKYINNLL